MRLPFPLSLGFFVIAGLVYVAQLTPLIGVALMIFAAPLWSIALVNMGFLGVALESALGVVHRLWLILPVLWFGGYAGWAATERLTLATEASAMRRNNAASAELRHASGPILIETNASNLAEPLAIAIVARYAASTVYVRTTLGDQVGTTTAYRFERDGLCNSAAPGGQPRIGRHDLTDGTPLREACVYSVAEDAPDDVVRIIMVRGQQDTSGPVAARTEVRAPRADGGVSTFRSTSAAFLPWLPRPILGCALNSGAAEWQCMNQFRRQLPHDLLTGQSATDDLDRTLAAALRLPPRTASTVDDPHSRARTAQLTAATSSTALDALDDMLADPAGTTVMAMDVLILEGQPDLIRPRIPAMMEVIERYFTDWTAWQNVAVLQGLLASVPESDFQPLKPRFASLYRVGREIPSDVASTNIMDRLQLAGIRLQGRSKGIRVAPLADASDHYQNRYQQRQNSRSQSARP